jgi:hypothetical protein
MVKRILNRSEKQTEEQLSPLAAGNGARIFTKLRVADVLEIENSGISSEQYSYALKAHFDFLICDKSDLPLFAVEFDGPSHKRPRQQRNDDLKNSLCDRLGLPLLRINSNHLTKRYRRMAPLAWLVDTWFISRAFDEAQKAGQIPAEEGFDPCSLIISVPADISEAYSAKASHFPFDLSLEARREIENLFRASKIVDPAPSWHIGRGEDGTLHGVACIRITENSGLWAESGMRAQLFSAELLPDLLDGILVCELFEKLTSALSGNGAAEPVSAMVEKARDHLKSYKLVASFTYGGNPCLADPIQRFAHSVV